MSMKRQIARNIERQNKKELERYSDNLRPNWQTRPSSDINLLVNMARNGITVDDMKREIERTRSETFERTALSVLKVAYATLAVVLVDEFGFSKDDCFKALNAVDHKMSLLIDNEEIIAEMEVKAGCRFHSENGVERIERV